MLEEIQAKHSTTKILEVEDLKDQLTQETAKSEQARRELSLCATELSLMRNNSRKDREETQKLKQHMDNKIKRPPQLLVDFESIGIEKEVLVFTNDGDVIIPAFLNIFRLTGELINVS